MHYKCRFFKSNPLSPNSFPVNRAPIRLAHSAVSLGVVCVCVCVRKASVISEAMCLALSLQAGSCLCASWPLETGDFTRRHVHAPQVWTKWRTHLCSCTNNWRNRENGHTHTNTHMHASKLQADLYNYAPDTASRLALSHWLQKHLISFRRCVRTHRSNTCI